MCLWPKILKKYINNDCPKANAEILVHQNNLNLTPELKIKCGVSSAHQIEKCSLVTKGNMGW